MIDRAVSTLPAENGVPWYVWACLIATTSGGIGSIWDISWHKSIGRDTFWTPAHILIYLCGIVAGLTCGYVILSTTFGPQPGFARDFREDVGLPRTAGRVPLRLGRNRHDYLGAL